MCFNVTLDPNGHLKLGDRESSVGIVFEVVYHRANISITDSTYGAVPAGTDMTSRTTTQKVTFSFYVPGMSSI